MSEYNYLDLEHARALIKLLSQQGRGPLAQLRRSRADERPGDTAQWLDRLMMRSGFGAVFEHPDDPPSLRRRKMQHREGLYLTAALYALIERPHDDESEEEAEARAQRQGKSMGYLLGTLYRQQQSRHSTEKRFLALLDADQDALPYQLRQMVSLLRGQDVRPDWARLLLDVMNWHDEKVGAGVRRRWANDFYRAAEETNAEDQDEDTNTTEEQP